jgi:hypothetical protein
LKAKKTPKEDRGILANLNNEQMPPNNKTSKKSTYYMLNIALTL